VAAVSKQVQQPVEVRHGGGQVGHRVARVAHCGHRHRRRGGRPAGVAAAVAATVAAAVAAAQRRCAAEEARVGGGADRQHDREGHTRHARTHR